MPETHPYDYAVIRLVPKVERDEFVNVGVILYCHAFDFAEARIELDETRLLAIAPDVDLETVRRHLASFSAVCDGTGPLGGLSKRERFLMLVAPRSTMIQPSAVHTGLCIDPSTTLDRLMDRLVRTGPANRIG